MQKLFHHEEGKRGLNPAYINLRDQPSFASARSLIRELSKEFNDLDGNFWQQFKTTGFDARVFELCLFAGFTRNGWKRDEATNIPDFIFEKDGYRIAIEATTANPSPILDKGQNEKHFALMSKQEIEEETARIIPDIPIRFGGPLTKKLNMKYWESEKCRDLPIILAIEGFWNRNAISYSDAMLIDYLYGKQTVGNVDSRGRLTVTYRNISEHKGSIKTIPSNFFNLEDAQHISAVMFSNSSTAAKFNRMGYQDGLRAENVRMFRKGLCFDHDPDATLPVEFEYDVGSRFPKETWFEGMSLFLNPAARIKLNKDFFDDFAVTFIEDDAIVSEIPEFHPVTSVTHTYQR